MEMSDPSGSNVLQPVAPPEPAESEDVFVDRDELIDLTSLDDSLAPDEPDVPPDLGLVAPPVVVVLVTSSAGAWLDDAVASLAAQDYPALSVLVLDNASAEDPTPRIAAAMPHAFIRRLDEDRGFAAAANEALHAVEGATFLCFCHDDVALEPDAIRLMVEEAYRSNAAVVGPKLVDYDNPAVLLEVGMAVDHYAVPFSGIEPGELDQEQHDAVRDVFFVSNAVMLVRADLFHELGGFDPATFPGSDDIDLCWRARLAGARVLVVPDARARHHQSTERAARVLRHHPPEVLRAAAGGRIRVLCKSYSAVALVWVLPIAFTLNLLESIGLVIAGRPARGRALLGGWFANIRNARGLRRARHATQRLRRVDDGDVRDLMIHGSARIREFLVSHRHAGDRLIDVTARTRSAVDRARTRVRQAPVVLGAILALLVIVGSRSLLLGHLAEVGSLRAWPGTGALWSTFTSPWRYAMVGTYQPGPPAFAMMAALSTALLGHAALAQSLIVAGALPLGAWGTYRVTRSFSPSPLPAVVAATVYAANPVIRNAIASGELGPLVTYALAPFALNALMRIVTSPDRRARLHAGLSLALLTAVMSALWPPALLLAVLAALAFVVASPLVGGWRIGAIALGSAIIATGLSFALLAPWSLSLLGADTGALGFLPRHVFSLGDLLRFHTGPAGAGVAPWGLLAAAALPLAVATGPRLAWAARAWMLAVAAFAFAWLPARLATGVSVPAVEGMLVPAALALAVAAGLGVAALVDDLPRFHFGWRQIAVVAAAAGITLTTLGLAGDAGSGRWRMPEADWSDNFAWMKDAPSPGGFRMLWLGDPEILPLSAKAVDGVGFGLTRDGPGDARALLAPPENRGEREVARAIRLARDDRTLRLGHLLAPVGVRYIAVLGRPAPGAGERGRPDPLLAAALARQLDLVLSREEDGALLYENDAWVPRRAVVPAGKGTVPVGSADPLAAAENSEIVATGVPGSGSPANPVPEGILLWAESADPGWRASLGDRALPRADAFGWTNAFTVPEEGRVTMRFRGGPARALLPLGLLLWVVVLVAWTRTRAGSREKAESAADRATSSEPGPLMDLVEA